MVSDKHIRHNEDSKAHSTGILHKNIRLKGRNTNCHYRLLEINRNIKDFLPQKQITLTELRMTFRNQGYSMIFNFEFILYLAFFSFYIQALMIILRQTKRSFETLNPGISDELFTFDLRSVKFKTVKMYIMIHIMIKKEVFAINTILKQFGASINSIKQNFIAFINHLS